MVACRYEISLLVFNSTTRQPELNTRREISYLHAPMYYFLFIIEVIYVTSVRRTNSAKTYSPSFKLCNVFRKIIE